MHVRFRRGNLLPYHQDFRSWQGIPWQPTFTVADGPRPDLLTLRARGYGVLDRTPSQYGNGALFIARDVIEDGACVVVEP